MSKILAGPYFTLVGLNTGIYTDQKKLHIRTLFTQCISAQTLYEERKRVKVFSGYLNSEATAGGVLWEMQLGLQLY